jgi:P-type conjugative transfer protein TrbJ
MKRNDYLRQIILGIVLAAVLIPVPAQAQWTVFDPSNYSIQIKRHIEDLSRWMETVNQYMRMYENAVGQLTHLQGILRAADELLAHDKRMRKLISYWDRRSD